MWHVLYYSLCLSFDQEALNLFYTVCGGGIRNSTDTSIVTIQLKPYVRWVFFGIKKQDS
jgi:hypothetical protein